MKYWLLLMGLTVPGWGWLNHIRAQNEATRQAQAAYRHGDPATAAAGFERALKATGRIADPGLLLNMAHAQARAGRMAQARATYGQLLSTARLPAALGSVARQQLAVLTAEQGNYVQALSLLRQALTIDPSNAGARYNYEVLREFLAQQPAPQLPTPTPVVPPAKQPSPSEKKDKRDGSPAPAPKEPSSRSEPATRAGSDRPGQVDDANKPATPGGTPKPRPDANGQPDPTRPAPAPGTAAGGFRPGAGEQRPQPTGAIGGTQQGLSNEKTGPPAPAGRSSQPGTEMATDADQQFQMQRERLRKLNLTPAQAQQLLEALRAQEQQYLQQRPRSGGRPAKPGQPTW
jgi:tetratricopeptide (TPR) repeat protein